MLSRAKFDLHYIYAHLEWPLHERPPPPEDDGAEEGEAVEGPDGEAEEIDQRPHVAAEHEQYGESALRGREKREWSEILDEELNGLCLRESRLPFPFGRGRVHQFTQPSACPAQELKKGT